MVGMNDFFTRQKANDGIKLTLTLPNGADSDHFLMIRGVDSDFFREAEMEAKRNAMQFAAIEDLEQRKEAMAEEKLALVAALILDWSFEEECTFENIKTFLREAPQIADQVDQVAARRTLFFSKGLSNS